MIDPHESIALLDELDASGEFKVLRRLNLDDLRKSQEITFSFDYHNGLVLDLSINGNNRNNPENQAIIELAVRPFLCDDEGLIVAIGDNKAWFEDPGEPISSETSCKTRLNDEDLTGNKIDDDQLLDLIQTADFIIAHRAASIRKIFEQRFPEMIGEPWCCLSSEIDWAEAGFTGSDLDVVLAQAGLFRNDFRRASSNCDAIIGMLRHRMPSGTTALNELLNNARRTSLRIEAAGAHPSARETLSARGYLWCPNRGTWWREIPIEARNDEEAWLAANIYAPRYRASESGPIITEMTWRDRHS